MLLPELRRSSGEVSLARLLAGDPVPASVANLTVRVLAELVCVGGWPGHLGSSFGDPPLSVDDAMAENRDYLDEVCRTDIPRVDGSDRDPVKAGRFLQSLGRNTSTCASMVTLVRDAGGPDRKSHARVYDEWFEPFRGTRQGERSCPARRANRFQFL